VTGGVARIRRFGNRCLRRTARPVDPTSPRTRELLDQLWATLAEDGGVGLAAPQIARDERVIVVLDPERSGDKGRLELVNPEIRRTFGPLVPFEEGCLSFPGLYVTVMRPKGVEVACDGPDGPRVLREEGLGSRIIQHEMDHLDGILFIDRLTTAQRITVLPRLIPFLVAETWLGIFDKKRGT